MSTENPVTVLIDSVLFPTARFRPGYRMSDVDDFLDQIAALVKDPADPTATRREAAEKVRGAKFETETFQETYEMEDVDDFLDDQLLPALEEGGSPAPTGLAHSATTVTADGQVLRDEDSDGPGDGPGDGSRDGSASEDHWSGGFTRQDEEGEDPLIAQLLQVRFPTAPRFAVNYPAGEVDSLLDDMIAALRAGPDRMSARREARRALQDGSLDRSRRSRDSYRAQDVDMFLLDVHNRLRGD